MTSSVSRALLRASAQARARDSILSTIRRCRTTPSRRYSCAVAGPIPSMPSTLAHNRRAHSSTSDKPSLFPPGQPPKFAFVFDIDGVLLRQSKLIPGAAETLRFVYDNNIPFVLLTNGGGKHDIDRAADLSARLGVPVSPDNFVQSHTPFKGLAEMENGYADKTVFATGSDGARCREIAESYGFKNVVIPADIIQACPDIFPFEPVLEQVYKDTARPLPNPICPGNADQVDGIQNYLKIDAVLVFNDPRDWAVDTQIILDLMVSSQGYLGTFSSRNGKSSLPNKGWLTDGQPRLYYSNSDTVWATQYHQPRLGQGAFQGAMLGAWKRFTGGQNLHWTSFGKPNDVAFAYAEKVLVDHRKEVLERAGHGVDGEGELAGLERVYMVGDNPKSDIQGANQFKSPTGLSWSSLLVLTGVTSPSLKRVLGTGGQAASPTAVADDVMGAVRWALEKEGIAVPDSLT